MFGEIELMDLRAVPKGDLPTLLEVIAKSKEPRAGSAVVGGGTPGLGDHMPTPEPEVEEMEVEVEVEAEGKEGTVALEVEGDVPMPKGSEVKEVDAEAKIEIGRDEVVAVPMEMEEGVNGDGKVKVEAAEDAEKSTLVSCEASATGLAS